MGRRTLLLLASLLLAALGTVLVFLYVQSADARATDDQEPVKVLVATKRIDAGTTGQQLTANQSVELKTIARSAVVPGALGNLNRIKTLAATTTIYPGEQIILDNFAQDAAAATVPITKGKLAVSVQLSDPARVAALLGVNTHVTVFATISDDAGKPKTDVLLPDVKVLGIGSQTTLTKRKPGAGGTSRTEETPATIVTLELTPQEAKKVVFASGSGELYFGLLGTGDPAGPNAGGSVNAGSLFGGVS
jgi:pilus assembly protein CpaB